MSSTFYTLMRGDDEIELEVEYSVSRFYPAQNYGPPGDCRPAEGGEVEEVTAFHNGEHFRITADEAREIERHIYETHGYDDN